MRAGALEFTSFNSISIISRGVTAFLFGILLVGSSAGGAIASGSEPVKKVDPLLQEDRVHKLSIFSYMQPLERDGRSVPIMVTLNIIGTKGLQTFCEYRPMIFEAVLNIITDEQVSAGDRRAVLADMKGQMLEAVNYSLPDAPVSSIDVRAGRSATEFGRDIVRTNRVCRKLDQLIR